VKSYATNTIKLSCAKIVFPSVSEKEFLKEAVVKN